MTVPVSAIGRNRKIWRQRASILVLAMLTPVAWAHLEGTCLLRLADKAEAMRRCEVSMQAMNDCDGPRQLVNDAAQECRAQIFIEPDIAHAIEHGQARVGGTPDISPYHQTLQTAARRQSLLQLNQAHFSAYFGLDKQHYLEMTDDYFDESSCPGAFRGVNGRYRLVGTRIFEPISLDRDEKPSIPAVTWHFYETLNLDACIAAPKAGQNSEWGAPAIVNVPRELLLEIAADRQRNKVYMCATVQDCKLQLDRLQELYVQYRDHQATYHRLEDCSIADSFVSKVSFTKAKKAPLVKQDAFCQQGELDTLLLNEKNFIEELEGSLFIHGRLP